MFISEGLWTNQDLGWKLTTFIRNTGYDLKQKNDSNCNFCNFSLSVPYSNNFLEVCICILIFHGIHSSLTHIHFFVRGKGVGGKKIFRVFVARGWENFKFLGDLLYWEDLISFLREGG